MILACRPSLGSNCGTLRNMLKFVWVTGQGCVKFCLCTAMFEMENGCHMKPRMDPMTLQIVVNLSSGQSSRCCRASVCEGQVNVEPAEDDVTCCVLKIKWPRSPSLPDRFL